MYRCFVHECVGATSIVIIDDSTNNWDVFIQTCQWSRYNRCFPLVRNVPSNSSSRIGFGRLSSTFLQNGGFQARCAINYDVIDAQVTMYYVAFSVQIFKPCESDQLNKLLLY